VPAEPVAAGPARPVRLTGRGLVLRGWEPADLPAMVELFDDPEIAYRTPLPTPFTPADAANRLRRAAQPGPLLLAITAEDAEDTVPLGEVMLKENGELGYLVGARYRGRGLATRAVLLLRDHAHEVAGMPVLGLKIEPDNQASIAVARGAGFHLSRPAAEVVQHRGRRCVLDLWEYAPEPSPRTLATDRPPPRA
jgi:RimJ/RimL family protein N-acetyltransferase